MNPHDICDWIRAHEGSRSYPDTAGFPPAPANMAIEPDEPEYVQFHRTAGYDLMSKAVGIASGWKRDDVRFYLRSYYRLVEDIDRQIGRGLPRLRVAALDDARPLHDPVGITPQRGQILVGYDPLRQVGAHRQDLHTHEHPGPRLSLGQDARSGSCDGVGHEPGAEAVLGRFVQERSNKKG